MKFNLWKKIGVLVFFSVLVSCERTHQVVRSTNADTKVLPMNICDAIKELIKDDLDKYQNDVDEASKNYQEEQWRVETADPKADNEKMSKLFEVVQEKTYNKPVLEQVLGVYKTAQQLSQKTCPEKATLVRAKELLETTILTNDAVVKKEKENQDAQDAMMTKSNAFRMTIPGEAEPVSRALYTKKLTTTPDRAEREKLYREFNNARALKWLEWGFKDLIKARNEEGKMAGYQNYYDYRFFRNQLNLQNYLAQVKELKKKLAPKMKKVLAKMGKEAGIDKVEGWDMAYLREKAASGEINEFMKNLPETSVLDMAKHFYDALGISIDSYHFLMDLYPRPGKNTHAFAMGVVPPHVDANKHILPDPKPDIRFLANLKKPVHWDDVSTVIHELGHAVHFGEIRQPQAILRGFGSVETEAIAMTLERMADSGEFLGDVIPAFTGTPFATLKPVLKKQTAAAQIAQAFVLMRQVFFSDFEYEIYKNPDQDFSALWTRLSKEYWGVDLAPELVDWDVEHFLMAPVYVENYAIGILMVEQFYDSIQKEFKTSYKSVNLGNKLKNVYFAPGLEFDYLALTKAFTGKPLSAEAALKLVP